MPLRPTPMASHEKIGFLMNIHHINLLNSLIYVSLMVQISNHIILGCRKERPKESKPQPEHKNARSAGAWYKLVICRNFSRLHRLIVSPTIPVKIHTYFKAESSILCIVIKAHQIGAIFESAQIQVMPSNYMIWSLRTWTNGVVDMVLYCWILLFGQYIGLSSLRSVTSFK